MAVMNQWSRDRRGVIAPPRDNNSEYADTLSISATVSGLVEKRNALFTLFFPDACDIAQMCAFSRGAVLASHESLNIFEIGRELYAIEKHTRLIADARNVWHDKVDFRRTYATRMCHGLSRTKGFRHDSYARPQALSTPLTDRFFFSFLLFSFAFTVKERTGDRSTSNNNNNNKW